MTTYCGHRRPDGESDTLFVVLTPTMILRAADEEDTRSKWKLNPTPALGR